MDSGYAIMSASRHPKAVIFMKNLIFISVIALVLTALSSIAFAEEGDDLKSDMGYFFGYSFGNMLKQGGNEDVDMDRLMEGMRDSLRSVAPNLTEAQQQAIIAEIQSNQQAMQQQAQAAQDQMATQNEAVGQQFLADNAGKDGVESTDSGLQLLVLEAGDGDSPAAESRVRVHYEGRLIDGTVFDSSYERGEPAEFALNQVIPGWTEGLQLMNEGGKYRLFIPSDLAYGPGGTRGIPPNSVLVFDVELLEIQ